MENAGRTTYHTFCNYYYYYYYKQLVEVWQLTNSGVHFLCTTTPTKPVWWKSYYKRNHTQLLYNEFKLFLFVAREHVLCSWLPTRNRGGAKAGVHQQIRFIQHHIWRMNVLTLNIIG